MQELTHQPPASQLQSINEIQTQKYKIQNVKYKIQMNYKKARMALMKAADAETNHPLLNCRVLIKAAAQS